MKKLIQQLRTAGVLGLSSDMWYKKQLRDVRWIRHVEGVRRYFWITLWTTTIISLMLLGLGLVALLQGIQDASSSSTLTLTILILLSTIFFLFFLLLSFIIDFYSVFNAVGLVRRERESGRLDLMRLSMGESGLLHALQSLSVSRTWRIVAWIVSVRIVWGFIGVIVGLLIWLVVVIAEPTYRIYTLFGLLWLPIGFLFLYWQSVIDPIWRVRLFSALGLYISERTNNRTTAIVYGLVGLFILNIVSSLGTQTIQIPINALSFTLGFMSEEQTIPAFVFIVFGFVVPFSALTLMAVSVLVFHAVREWLLRSTANHIQ